MQIPERVFGLFDPNNPDKPQAYMFIANHRAWHTLERMTGKSLFEALDDLRVSGRHVGPWQELAWSLCSTHRGRMASPPTYEEFLDILPVGERWNQFSLMLAQLVMEAFPSEKKPTAPATPPKKSRRGQ